MKIVPLTRELYEQWSKFCIESDDAWFWHTTDYLDFTINLRPELKSQSLSFLIFEDRVPIAVCPLVLDTIIRGEEVRKCFSFDRTYGIVPALKTDLTKKQKDSLLKEIFTHIDDLAQELDVKSCLLKFSPLAPAFYRQPQFNYLMKFGFLNTSLNTQVIDLSPDLEALNKQMRKGHRHNVHQGEEAFEVKIFDQNSITQEIFDQYRLLHHKDAGRITRPLLTFEMMHRWIREGKSVLCSASHNGIFLGFALIIVYKEAAYYGSACQEPNADVCVPSAHIIQWKVISWLKEKGYKFYELGLQQFGNQFYDFPLEKDRSISFFKRGFGGNTLTLFQGEKFYDQKLLSETLSSRSEKLLRAVSFNYVQEG